LFHGRPIVDAFDDPSLGRSSGSGSVIYQAWLLSSLLLPFMTAAIAHVIAARRMGDPDVSAGSAIGRALRRTWALLASWLIVHAFDLLGIFTLFGSVALMPLFAPVAAIVAIEGLGPIRAVRRSWRLVAKRYWPAARVAVGVGIVVYAVEQALAALPSTLGFLVGLKWGWLLLALGSSATRLLTAPLVAATTVCLYFDLRAWGEGLDLVIEADRVFGGDVG